MTAIIFVIVLAVLIFVHELGHFLFAKANNIRVDAFAIGFGPKLISWKGKETTYAINLIPFGGYVKIFGENPDEESITGPDSARSFVNKTRWQQALVLVAGVFFNFIFAWFLYASVFFFGVTATTDGFEKYSASFRNSRIMVTEVLPDSPADKAGIKMGDNIVEVKAKSAVSQPASQSSSADSKSLDVESIQNTINDSKGSPLTFVYIRGADAMRQTLEVTPVQGIVDDRYAIGIAMQKVADLHLPFLASVYEGAHYTLLMMRETAVGLYQFFSKIFIGKANFTDVAGPVGIAGIVGSAASLGFNYLMMVTALISINLGIINLVPFPALDGGRILFVLIESVIRRKISPKVANTINAVGFTFLIVLMVVITFQDISKLIK